MNDLEWKEQLAQLSEDLRTNSRLVEARNDETEKTAELTEQMRRLHDRFGSTERQIKGAALDELQSRRVDDRQRSSYAVDSTNLVETHERHYRRRGPHRRFAQYGDIPSGCLFIRQEQVYHSRGIQLGKRGSPSKDEGVSRR